LTAPWRRTRVSQRELHTRPRIEFGFPWLMSNSCWNHYVLVDRWPSSGHRTIDFGNRDGNGSHLGGCVGIPHKGDCLSRSSCDLRLNLLARRDSPSAVFGTVLRAVLGLEEESPQ
jgi:hypothetical protein